jgi:hypothetical protein
LAGGACRGVAEAAGLGGGEAALGVWAAVLVRHAQISVGACVPCENGKISALVIPAAYTYRREAETNETAEV